MSTLAGLAQGIPRGRQSARGLPLYPLAPPRIDLGTSVLTSLNGSRTRSKMTEEGVVIEIVPPYQEVQSERVIYRARLADEERYVIQCWSVRLLRHARALRVVSP